MSRHNPWTSIADLMSGFVVVLLILFATAAALPHFATPEPAPALTPEQQQATEREAHRRALWEALDARLAPFATQGLVRLSPSQQLIEFSDVSFATGSACLTTQAKSAVDAVAPILAEEFRRDPSLTIQVEGHCDPLPVQGVMQACGWFADNTQLSALRASNVREMLAANAGPGSRARMPVTGWGPDRLRNTTNPYAAENRRVELHIVWRGAEASAP